MDCKGKFNPWQMEWDHRNPEQKVFNISSHPGFKDFKKELAKCDLVCANCHKNRTHSRRRHVTHFN